MGRIKQFFGGVLEDWPTGHPLDLDNFLGDCPSKRAGVFSITIGGQTHVGGGDGNLHDCYPTSPLVLDLDGDGVNAGAVAQFDHGGDGFAEATRWVGEDDGMLVWDRNGDGVINDGSELFGNRTVRE